MKILITGSTRFEGEGRRRLSADGLKAVACSVAAAVIILLPIARIVVKKMHDWFLVDFAAYCAVSRALFDGNNPFPDRMEFVRFLLRVDSVRTDVPIVYLHVRNPYVFRIPSRGGDGGLAEK